MANKFCVSLTSAKDNTDKATVAFVVANAAVGSGSRVPLRRRRPLVAERLRRRHPRGRFRPAPRAHGQLRQGGRYDLRLLALFQRSFLVCEGSLTERTDRQRAMVDSIIPS